MRLKQQNTKEWFNSYLIFQHVKENSSSNLVHQDDMNNMWSPYYSDVNSYNIPTRLRELEEILKIIPHPKFEFILNSKSEHNNARLFEVCTCTHTN